MMIWTRLKVVQYDCKVYWIDCSGLVHRSVIVRTPLLMYFGRRTPLHWKFILTIKFVLQIAVHIRCREASIKSDELQFTNSVSWRNFWPWRPQSVLISTTLELLSTALNCRIIIKTSAHRFYGTGSKFNSLSSVPWLAGDVNTQSAKS